MALYFSAFKLIALDSPGFCMYLLTGPDGGAKQNTNFCPDIKHQTSQSISHKSTIQASRAYLRAAGEKT